MKPPMKTPQQNLADWQQNHQTAETSWRDRKSSSRSKRRKRACGAWFTGSVGLGGFKYFLFSPILGKWSNLKNIFQLGWNHQLEAGWNLPARLAYLSRKGGENRMSCTEFYILKICFLKAFCSWCRSVLPWYSSSIWRNGWNLFNLSICLKQILVDGCISLTMTNLKLGSWGCWMFWGVCKSKQGPRLISGWNNPSYPFMFGNL